MRTREVTDELNRVYKLIAEIGSGGQGSVFLVEGERFAVKILQGNTDIKKERLRDQLAFVKRQPTGRLPLAKPLSLLKAPHVGYVMEFASGMEPLLRLIHPTRGTTSINEWYKQTGGLKRRLIILAKIAEVLNELHSIPLVYSDLSPNNVFISREKENNEVFFIDVDNLAMDSWTARRIYTPLYGAPEIVKEEGLINTKTDTYSFAVIAFSMLTLMHPLLGDDVENGPPELENKALRGELPWIEHAEDKSNICKKGIDRQSVISPKLMELFRKVFEDGLNTQSERPKIAKWEEFLWKAQGVTITCPACGQSYYAIKEEKCPWCRERRPKTILIKFKSYISLGCDGSRKSALTPTGDGFVVADNSVGLINKHQVFCGFGEHKRDVICEIKIRSLEIEITPKKDGIYLARRDEKDWHELKQTCKLKLGDGKNKERDQLLHFGNKDTDHRVAEFNLL
jgi:eukaryotic-like serine/threonine-protein kinase